MTEEESAKGLDFMRATGWHKVRPLYSGSPGDLYVDKDPKEYEDVGPLGWPDRFFRVRNSHYPERCSIEEFRRDPKETAADTNPYGHDYYSKEGKRVRGMELAGAINNHCVQQRLEEEYKEALARAWPEE